MNNRDLPKLKPWLHYSLLAVLLLTAWSVQSAPDGILTVWGISPVLLVSLIACIGMIYGEMIGGVFGLAAGLLMDVYTTPCVGFHIVVLTAVGIGCGLIIRHLFMNNLLASFTLILGVCLVYFVLYWLLFKVILGGGGGWVYLYRFSLSGTVYSAVFGGLFYPLLKWLHRYW